SDLATKQVMDVDYTKYNFRDSDESYEYKFPKGLTREVVERISKIKKEPDWMLEFRLRSYDHFLKRPLPMWGGELTRLKFDDMVYYASPTEKKSRTWEDVPPYIKDTFDKLGIPEAERKFLGGVGAQYESEVVYHSLREDLAKKGVIFTDTDTALREYPEIFKKHFATVVPLKTTSSQHSTVPSGAVEASSTSQKEFQLTCHFKHISESTQQTWGNSNEH